MAFADSLVVYEGEWSQGMRHGQGTLFSNSEKTAFYKGEFHCSTRAGARLSERGVTASGKDIVSLGGHAAESALAHAVM